MSAVANAPAAIDDERCLTLAVNDRDVAQNLPDLRWNVLHHVLAGHRHVIVDLTDVAALSSTAVAALLNIHRVLRSHGGRLDLRRPSPASRELLQRTGLDRVLHVDTAPQPQPVPVTTPAG